MVATIQIDHLNALANGEERPFIQLTRYELREVAKSNRDDAFVLFQVCSETDVRVKRNPNSKSKQILDEFQPILNKLIKNLFPPEPDPIIGEGQLPEATDWPKVGLLKHMGYAVGAKAASADRRRRLLLQVFNGPIPNVEDRAYMSQWGSDRSTKRLRKLAWDIASFASLRIRKRNGNIDESIANWKADLEWLRQKIYFGHFKFPWPVISCHR